MGNNLGLKKGKTIDSKKFKEIFQKYESKKKTNQIKKETALKILESIAKEIDLEYNQYQGEELLRKIDPYNLGLDFKRFKSFFFESMDTKVLSGNISLSESMMGSSLTLKKEPTETNIQTGSDSNTKPENVKTENDKTDPKEPETTKEPTIQPNKPEPKITEKIKKDPKKTKKDPKDTKKTEKPKKITEEIIIKDLQPYDPERCNSSNDYIDYEERGYEKSYHNREISLEGDYIIESKIGGHNFKLQSGEIVKKEKPQEKKTGKSSKRKNRIKRRKEQYRAFGQRKSNKTFFKGKRNRS